MGIPIKLVEHDAIKSMSPVMSYDQQRKLFYIAGGTPKKSGAIGFGFVCAPMTGANTSTENQMALLLKQEWPKNTLINVQLCVLPDIRGFLDQYMAERTAPEGSTLHNLCLNYAEFLEQGAKKKILPDGTRVNNQFVLITVRIPVGKSRPPEHVLDEYSDRVRAIRQNLYNVGLAPAHMNAQHYIRFMQTVFDQHDGARWKNSATTMWDTATPINEQVADLCSNLTNEDTGHGLQIGDRPVRILSAKKLPEVVAFGMSHRYMSEPNSGVRGIKENCILSLSVLITDKEKESAKFQRQRLWNTHQAFGPVSKLAPRINQLKESTDIMGAALDDGDRPMKVFFNIILFPEKGEEAQCVANAEQYLVESGFTMMHDKYISLPIFIHMLPFGGDPDIIPRLARYKSVTSRHANAMMPIISDWGGTGTPALPFISRRGQLMAVSMFDSDSNMNGIVTAKSGAGKSTVANFITFNYLAMGGLVRIIDNGRSYAKLAEALGGQIIDIEHQDDICINPFQIVEDFEKEREFLAGMVMTMAFNLSSPGDRHRAAVDKVLSELWAQYGNSINVDMIAERLEGDPSPMVQDIGHQLYPFTTKGSNGRYVNGNNNVNFNNDLVIVELKGLEGRDHLQRVFLYTFIYQIGKALAKAPLEQKKIVLVDECWALLTGGDQNGSTDAADMIKAAYRTYRKTNASVLICTQSLFDVYENPGGQAISANSTNLYLLEQEDEIIDQVKNSGKLVYPEGVFKMMESVRTEKGVFSEIFMKTDRGIGIARFVASPYMLLLFSSAPEDNVAIQAYRKQGLSLDDAIKAVLYDRSMAAAA